MSFTLISRLSPTTTLRADAIPFRSSAVPRTIRRCILRPSGPPSRHLKHQTSGPRFRRSTVTLPSCMLLPLPARLKQGNMLTGVINLRSLVASKARLNAALRRQHFRFQPSLQLRSPVLSGYLPDEQSVVVQFAKQGIHLVDKRIKNFKRFGLRVSQLGSRLDIQEHPGIFSTSTSLGG